MYTHHYDQCSKESQNIKKVCILDRSYFVLFMQCVFNKIPSKRPSRICTHWILLQSTDCSLVLCPAQKPTPLSSNFTKVLSLHLQRHKQVSCRWSLHNVQCWIPIKSEYNYKKYIKQCVSLLLFSFFFFLFFFPLKILHSEGWAFTRYFALSTSLSQKWVVWMRCVVVIYCLSSSSCSPLPHSLPKFCTVKGWAFTRYFTLSTGMSQKWAVWLRCVVVIYCILGV